MYLLILSCPSSISVSNSVFTSHYVSINSSLLTGNHEPFYIFTSHYVSINSSCFLYSFIAAINLHPTMYLLIRFFIGMFPGLKSYLHPTMYLLILISSVSVYIPSVHLHPTMYLLIRSAFISKVISCNHLHPTMYLLILSSAFCIFFHVKIYIPLCIY